MYKEEAWVVFGSIGLMVLILVGVYLANSAACTAKSVSFEDHDYGVFQGCMVKHNGRWLPLENIRGFDDKG
jgi:hypothetical protein